MAVNKKHNRSVSSKSAISTSDSGTSGGEKTAGEPSVTDHYHKAASYKQKAVAPSKASTLSILTAIERDLNPAHNASESVTDELKLTIATKEELENSRISAYRYIL